MKKLLLLCIAATLGVHAQKTAKTDSLLQVLQNQQDTVRLNTLYAIITDNLRSNREFAKPYVDSLLTEAGESPHQKFLALAYKAEGVYHYYASDYRAAKKSYEQSIAIYEVLGLEVPLSRLYNNQGITLKYLGELKAAKTYHLKSLRIKEALGLSPSDIAASLVNLGTLELELGNKENSTNYYLQAEQICLENDLIWGLNLVRGNLAGNYTDLGEFEKGLSYYQQVLAYHTQNDDKRNTTRITNSIGALYFAWDSIAKAREYYEKAYALSKANDIEQMRGLATRNLGKVAMKEKRYADALTYFEEAAKISEQTGSNVRNVGDYLNIAEAYAAMGNYEAAYTNREIHFQKYDSVFSAEKIEQINELEVRYQTEKKEAEIALQQEAINTLNEKARVDALQKGLFAGGMGSVLALSGLLVFGFRQRIKKNRIAREKQEEIYKREIEHKKKELASQTLHLVQKNTFIQELIENLENIKKSPEKFKVEFRRIVMLLKKENASDKDWEVFKSYFSEVHNDFDEKIRTLYPEISEKELRLAAFLRMKLTTKEMAATLNVLPDSVLKSKYRLKKKLGLGKDTDLGSFLQSIG